MSIQERFKNITSSLTRVAVSVILLWVVFTRIDLDKTWGVLKSADISFVVYGALGFLLTTFIILGRWFIFIKALDISTTVMNVVRCFFVGLFGNLFLPTAIGGDVIKIIGLCQGSTQKAKVVASVVLDRLSGFGGISLVALVAFALGYRYIGETSILVIIGLMLTGSVFGAAVLFNEKIYAFFCKAFYFIPKLQKSVMQMHYDIALLKDKKVTGFKTIGLSCITQLIYALVWYCIAISLHQEISVIYFFIFVPIICVMSSFPSLGGLGVREAGTAFLFTKVGVSPEAAVSMSLISYFYMVLVGILGGIIYVVTVPSGRTQHRSSSSFGDNTI